MVSQLARANSRRVLARLFGEAVLEYLSGIDDDIDFDIVASYEKTCRRLTRSMVEAYISREISDEEIEENPDLEFLKPTRCPTDFLADSPKVKIALSFLEENLTVITIEDLGGISELFSGHRVARGDSSTFFQNNEDRRGFGRIYTPFDVTLHMCEESIPPLVRKCESFEDFVKLRIIDPACGSGAFLTQASRILAREAVIKWPGYEEQIRNAVF